MVHAPSSYHSSTLQSSGSSCLPVCPTDHIQNLALPFYFCFPLVCYLNLIYTNRAEKEKGQLKSEVEDLQAQIQNIVKNKVLERFR